MSKDYLWDPSAEPDDGVKELEDQLRELGFDHDAPPDPFEWETMKSTPTLPAKWFLVVAIGAATVLVAWLLGRPAPDVKVPHVPPVAAPVRRVQPPPASQEPSPAIVEPDLDEAPPEPKQTPARPRATPAPAPKDRLPPKHEPEPADTAEPESAPTANDGAVSVECILEPCPTIDESLPPRPSRQQIRAALRPIIDRARACGSEHDAASGSLVRVRMTIEGGTGHVQKAHADAPHTDTLLGRCVAEAVLEARFPRFRGRPMGLQYSFRMP